MRYQLIAIFLLFSLTNCQRNKMSFEKDNKIIIQKCIDKVLERYERDNNCYLVQQFLDTLNFFHPLPMANNYSTTGYTDKQIQYIEKILDKGNVDIDKLDKFENDTILNCSNSCLEVLTDLSTCDKSDLVFSTTKIYDNLIQIRFADYREEFNIAQMKDTISQINVSGFQRAQSRGNYLFVIHNNKNVEILDGDYYTYFN